MISIHSETTFQHAKRERAESRKKFDQLKPHATRKDEVGMSQKLHDHQKEYGDESKTAEPGRAIPILAKDDLATLARSLATISCSCSRRCESPPGSRNVVDILSFHPLISSQLV